MSGPRLSIVQGRVCEDERFKLSHLKLLLFHGRVSDNNGWSWLYQESTAKKLSISRETVNRCLKDLVHWGYIQKKHFNRYGKRICAVRVILDYGEPALPETLRDDDPDGFKEFVKNNGQFVANDDQKTSKNQALKLANMCEPDITGRVTSGANDMCATDHRTCDAELTCDPRDHRTCDIGDHTERRIQPLKGGGGNNKLPREDKQATASPLLKSLFEEYNATAKRAGFTPVSENLFDDVVDQLNSVIEKIGVEKWRECLAIAACDDLCCGRVKPSANYGTPWVLNFKQMCDAVWVDSKLDEWRRAGKQPKTHNPNAQTITPESESWQAWQAYFGATNHKFNLKRMVAGEAVAVPTEWPPSAEMKQSGGAR